MQYLDGVSTFARWPTDRWPLKALIDHSAVLTLLRAHDYEVVFIGSPYAATSSLRDADVCVCDGPVVGDFESQVLNASPLRALGASTLAYREHRLKLLTGLEALAQWRPGSRPQMVFAHLLAPHPPFLVGAAGSLSNPARAFGMQDGSFYGGSKEEYRAGYAAQAQFTLRALTAALESALRHRANRDVVIFVHGDHGSGSSSA